MISSRWLRQALPFVVFLMAFCLWQPSTQAASLYQANTKLVREQETGNIYALTSGHKYLFRGPSLLASYYFQTVTSVTTAADLARVPNVSLVYSTIGPRVYLLEPQGQKLWVPTEEAFRSAGFSFSDVFLLSHPDIRSYRNAQLVRATGTSTVYYLDYDSLTRAPFSSTDDVQAAGFSTNDIVEAPPQLLDAYIQVAPFTPQTPHPPVVNTPTVEVSKQFVATASVPSGTTQNKILSLSFAASGGDVAIRGLTFHKTGFLADTDTSDITIVDQDGFRLASVGNFANGTALITLASAVNIPSGETRTLSVLLGIKPTIAANLSQVGLTLEAADISTNAKVIGSFPLTSASFQVVKSSGAIGQLAVDTVVVAPGVRQVVTGSTSQLLNKFMFSVSNAAEDVLLRQVVVTILGTANGDLRNFKLVDESNHAVPARIVQHDQVVLFDLSKNQLRIPRGGQHTLSLLADVFSGQGRTVQTLIVNEYDIEAHGATTGYSIPPIAGKKTSGFPIGGNGSENTVQIIPGQVAVSLNSTSPAVALARGGTDMLFASYDVRALGVGQQLQSFSVRIDSSGAKTPLFGIIKVRLKGGAVLATVDAGLVQDRAATISLSPPPSIASGKTITLELLASVDSGATIEDTYQVTASQFMFTDTGGNRLTSATPVVGPSRGIQDMVLRVRSDPASTAYVTVAGRKGVKLGRFLFQVSGNEPLIIQQVSLTPVQGQVLFSEGYSNLRLGNSTIATPTASPFLFTLNSTVNPGSEVGFDLVVDTTTATSGDIVQLGVSDLRAIGKTSGAEATLILENATTPTLTLKETTLTFSANPNFAGGGTLMGKGVVVGSFVLSADAAENVQLTKLTIAEAVGSSGLSTTRGYKNVRLVDAATQKGISATFANPAPGQGGNVITSGPTIKPGQPLTVNIVVDATNVLSGDAIQLVLLSAETKGSASGLIPLVSGLPLTLPIVNF